MAQLFALESFDPAVPQESPTDVAYQEGFAAGLEAGRSAAEAAQTALQADLVQAVADLEFTYSEARGEMTRALAPFMQALISKVLPHCVETGFAAQIAATITDHLRNGQSDGLSIITHPSQAPAIAAALGDRADRIAWGEDAALDRHAAWIGHQSGELLINFDQLLDEITEILRALDPDTIRSDSNG